MNSLFDNWFARWSVVGLGALFFVVVALLFFFNPADHAFFPVCVFHRVTGLNCPGCGGLRAVHQLLHGHLKSAFWLNPLFVVTLPPVVIFFANWIFQKVRGRKVLQPVRPLWFWIGFVALIAFGIARNLPFGPFAWMSQMPQ